MGMHDLPKIGFVGIGLMGRGMAQNLLKKDYPLTVIWHRNRKPLEALLAQGADEASTVAELAKGCDIIFLCLPASAQIESVVAGPGGLLTTAKPGTIIVDCSTADPSSTLALYAQCKDKKIGFADAPLGGTPTQADEGTLTALVGADEDIFEKIEPVCKAWATNVLRLGPVSSGHKMKLLNNFLSLSYGALYAEALAIARKSDLSIELFDSVIRGSRMDCGFYQTFMQYVLAGDKQAHKFTLANAHKDVTYLNAMADSAGVATQIGSAVKNIYTYALNQDSGEDFVPEIANLIAKANAI